MALKFGQPSAVDPSPHGIAIWNRDKLAAGCLDRIEIRDEAIPHCHPENHFDYVYGFITYNVPQSRFLDVTNLTENVGYDAGKKQLWARCSTIEAVIATLALITQIAQGFISLNYAEANNLYNHYLTASQDPNQTSRLYDLLCYNIKHQQL
jgi:hypothetical protein